MNIPGEQPTIRDTLFGDMPLSAWAGLEQVHLGEPWASFSRAKASLDSGHDQQAVEALKNITQAAGLESRHYLQAWHFLRQLGVAPPDRNAKEVHGVVVEVGLEEGLDIVAAYADHRARYFNYSGAGVIWEHPESSLDPVIDALLGAAERIVDHIGPWQGARPAAPASGEARVNILTPSGLHFGQGPYGVLAADQMAGPVLRAALALMQALIDRSRQARA